MNLINLICLQSFVPLAASLAGPVIVDETAPVPTAPITNSVFTRIAGSPNAFKIIDNRDGYVYYYNSIYKAPYTNLSNLYLLEEEMWFTPGDVPASAGYSQYVSGTRLGKGSVELEILQYGDAERNISGGVPYVKAFWPQSSKLNTTISSSCGGTMSKQSAWGNSASVGYSAGNGASVKASSNSSGSSSLSVNWEKSLSTLVDDPIVSSQYSPSSSSSVLFTYQVINPEISGLVTFYFDCFVLFELSKQITNCKDSTFKFEFHVRTQDYWYKNKWFDKGWKFGDLYIYDLTVTVDVPEND